MSVKYDAEDLLDTILSIMTTGDALNAKITAIDAEKTAAGKSLTPALKLVPTDGFYLQTWNDKILNTSPAIFYGIEEVTALANGPVVSKTYSVFVEIVMVDSGMTNDSARRINRYSRALEELFASAFSLKEGFMISVAQVRPIAFKLELDSDEEIKVGGISLTIGIA